MRHFLLGKNLDVLRLILRKFSIDFLGLPWYNLVTR